MELHDSYRKSLKPVLMLLLVLAVIEFIVWLTPALRPCEGFSGYVPIHTILETAAIIVSAMVFAAGWSVPKENSSSSSLLLAIVFFGVGVLDLLHMLSYEGMPDFITPNNPEKAIYFWLLARVLSAIGLLMLAWSPCGNNLSIRRRWFGLVAVFVLLVAASVIGFNYPELIPRTFVPGRGLTGFKVWMEYFIIALFIASAFGFLMKMRSHQPCDVQGLFVAVSVMALSELFFTFYASVTDISNLLGHVYKVIAYGFIYKSVFLNGFRQPYLELNSSRNLLQMVIDHLPLRVFWKDRESRYLGCNTAFSQDAGEVSPADVIGKLDAQLAWRQQADLYRSDDLQVINSNIPKLNFEEPQTTPEGRRIWLNTSKVPLVGPNREVMGVLGVYEDITNQKRLEDELRLAYGAVEHGYDLLNKFSQRLPGVIYQFRQYPDGRSCFPFASEGINDIFEVTPEQVREDASAVFAILHPEDYDRIVASIQESAQTLKLWQCEFRIILPIQGIRWRLGEASPERLEDGSVLWHGFIYDVTQRKQAEELGWFNANFDYLTGLPNRRMFQDRLAQEIKKSHRTGLLLALLFIDLDNFKEINDTLGHAKGDMLLSEAADRLTSCVRDSDTVARFGGDEFTIILSDLHDSDDITRVAMLILQKIAEPFNLDGEIVYMTGSIGVTCYPDDGTDIEVLLKNADQAMYAAKAAGRNGYSYFTPSMQSIAQSRMKLANDLRAALKGDQLWVAYQPIIDLKSKKIVKAEALVRWRHPQLGMVSPAEFIPIAEHTGLINSIGEFVFHEATSKVEKWQQLYDKEFQISVNVSPVQFGDKSGNYKPWYQQLNQLGLSGKSIVVEITEGLLLEANDRIKDKLLEFRDAGIQVAIDDFGTGYSSLSYLRKFDIDYIKIDQSFVRGMTTNAGDVALCEAMIVMAHKLDMMVIAEGVETIEQQELLAGISCDFGQGYLFSKPLPANEFEQLLLQT